MSVALSLWDDVADQIPVVAFGPSDFYVDEPLLLEPPTVATFTLNRTGPVNVALTVEYDISGTAENGVDYVLLSEQATFAPGSATTTIELAVLADEIFDDLEDVVLTIRTVGTAYEIGSIRSAIARIIDQTVMAVASVNVASVEFLDALPLRLDDGQNMPTPQWKTPGNIYPVAYPQNQPADPANPDANKIKVKVTIKLTNPAAFNNKTIKLIGGHVVNFQGQEVWQPEFEAKAAEVVEGNPTIRVIDDWISLDNMRGSTGVGYYNRTFNWRYAVDPTPETDYTPIEQTSVPWYSTFMSPKGDVKLYRTVVHLGCVSNHTGSVPVRTPQMTDIQWYTELHTAEASLRDSIWNADGGFASRQVKNYSGEKLYYYKKWTEKDIVDAKLLTGNKDAQCSAWAMLFRDVMMAQGFDNYDLVKITAKIPNEFFMVKSWNFPAGDGPYTNRVGLSPTGQMFKDTGGGVYAYNFLAGSQVTDGNGIPGQNTANPASLFQNHVVLGIVELVGGQKRVNRLYDPSYGEIYQAIAGMGTYADVMQSTAIAGFYKLGMVPGMANARELTIRKPTANLEIVATPYTTN